MAQSGGPLNKKQMQLLAESLGKKTRFNKHECELLLDVYKTLTKDKNKIDRTLFRDILHHFFEITDDVILDRVFKAFDKDSDGFIAAEEWIRGMSVFLKGQDDDITRFCFEVYDFQGDSYITREEMYHFLKNCLVKISNDEDPEEGVKDLIEIVFKKLDEDRDGRISYQDFKNTIEKGECEVELLGNCLPSEQKKREFMQMFENEDIQQRIKDILEAGDHRRHINRTY